MGTSHSGQGTICCLHPADPPHSAHSKAGALQRTVFSPIPLSAPGKTKKSHRSSADMKRNYTPDFGSPLRGYGMPRPVTQVVRRSWGDTRSGELAGMICRTVHRAGAKLGMDGAGKHLTPGTGPYR